MIHLTTLEATSGLTDADFRARRKAETVRPEERATRWSVARGIFLGVDYVEDDNQDRLMLEMLLQHKSDVVDRPRQGSVALNRSAVFVARAPRNILPAVLWHVILR